MICVRWFYFYFLCTFFVVFIDGVVLRAESTFDAWCVRRMLSAINILASSTQTTFTTLTCCVARTYRENLNRKNVARNQKQIFFYQNVERVKSFNLYAGFRLNERSSLSLFEEGDEDEIVSFRDFNFEFCVSCQNVHRQRESCERRTRAAATTDAVRRSISAEQSVRTSCHGKFHNIFKIRSSNELASVLARILLTCNTFFSFSVFVLLIWCSHRNANMGHVNLCLKQKSI